MKSYQSYLTMTLHSEIYTRCLSMVQYTRSLFEEYKKAKLISSTALHPTPSDLPTQMIADCRHIAAITAAAIENPSMVLPIPSRIKLTCHSLGSAIALECPRICKKEGYRKLSRSPSEGISPSQLSRGKEED